MSKKDTNEAPKEDKAGKLLNKHIEALENNLISDIKNSNIYTEQFKKDVAVDMTLYFKELSIDARIGFDEKNKKFTIDQSASSATINPNLENMNKSIDTAIDGMVKGLADKVPAVKRKNELKIKILEAISSAFEKLEASINPKSKFKNVAMHIGGLAGAKLFQAEEKNFQDINKPVVNKLSAELKSQVEEIKKSVPAEKTKEPVKDKGKLVVAKPSKGHVI